MRILYYHRTLADGAEGIHIREIVHCFRELGHEVKVVSLLSDENADLKESWHQNALSFKDRIVAKLRWMLPGFVYELAEILTNIPAARLVENSIKGFKPDFIYERYSNYGIAVSRVARKHEVPLILEANVPYYRYKLEWEKLYFPRLLRYVEKKVFEDVDHIIAVSTPLKKAILEYGIDEKKITVMPNGVDVGKFKPLGKKQELKKKYSLDSDLVLGFVGAVRSWHKMDELFDVLHEINLDQYNAKMIIVGDCTIRDELDAHIDRLGERNNIHFLGRVPHNHIPEYIEMMDITISPFAVAYSSPMKILEYMAMGKCVVAPNMENIRDIITEDITGVLFESGNKESLRTSLIDLIEDEDKRSNISMLAQKTACESYTWNENARFVVDIAVSQMEMKSKVKSCVI